MSRNPLETLPMHLALSLMNLTSCESALRVASDASGSWSAAKNKAQPQPKTKRPQKNAPPLSAQQALAHLEAMTLFRSPKRTNAKRLNDNPRHPPPPKGKNSLPHPRGEAKNNQGFAARSAPPWQDICPQALARAVQTEAKDRCYRMLHGIDEYQHFEMEVEEAPHDVIWQKAKARLLDYGGEGSVVLLIPSLINRYYILDLYPQRSLVRFLLTQGFRPIMLDWGSPGPQERCYDTADYVQKLLCPALRYLSASAGESVHLMGYCMGGVLAMAAAVAEPHAVRSLSLLATPWDFSARARGVGIITPEAIAHFQQLLARQDTMPAGWVQATFHAISPWHFQEKFAKFSAMPLAEKQHFAAVESWANDGVPLARKVALECFVRWPTENLLCEGKWRVAGHDVTAKHVPCPVFIAVPSEDKIVPTASSQPLVRAFVGATVIRPACGHISMVVGRNAKKNLWQPWRRWLMRYD